MNILIKYLKLYQEDREANIVNFYQNQCRVYLDEYPEQKESRQWWFLIRNSEILLRNCDGVDEACTFTDETYNENVLTYEKLRYAIQKFATVGVIEPKNFEEILLSEEDIDEYLEYDLVPFNNNEFDTDFIKKRFEERQ